MTKLISILIMILFVTTGVLAEFNQKSYELPNHGVLSIEVPNTWNDQVNNTPGGLPPTIRFSQQSGEKFEIYFTPIWKTPTAPANFGTTESIKQMVQGAAMNASTQAVEKSITVKEIGGLNKGFYFTATDKAPKPGEYKILTQGVVGINEIIGTFTILTNDSSSAEAEQAIKMFGSLRYSP